MAFHFWTDLAMTQPAGVAMASGVPLQSVIFDTSGVRTVDFTLYFGSPERSYHLQTRVNGGIDAVTLMPEDALPPRLATTDYAVGAVVEGTEGSLYKCVVAGRSGDSTPKWLTQRGGRTNDGTVVWHCMGAAHKPSAVKMALSVDGLDGAKAGAGLPLGTRIKGGAAVAVYFRVENTVNDRYDAQDIPQLSININDCVEVET